MLPQAHEILIKSILAQESITKHKRNMEKLKEELVCIEHDRKGQVYL